MSMNIPNALLDISDVTVTAHIENLGPVQQNAYKRGLASGIIITGGVPAMLAYELRKYAGLPCVNIKASQLKWRNLHEADAATRKALMEALGVGLMAAMLDLPAPTNGYRNYARESLERAKEAVDNNHYEGSVWLDSKYMAPAKRLLKSRKFTLTPWLHDVPERIVVCLDRRGYISSARPA